MRGQSTEARVIFAIEAIRSSKKLSCRAAAKLYNVPETTLRNRMKGRTSITEYRPATHALTEIEEEVVVQYILSLDLRGFPPLIGDVAAIANNILTSRGTCHVGKQWPYRFIQ